MEMKPDKREETKEGFEMRFERWLEEDEDEGEGDLPGSFEGLKKSAREKQTNADFPVPVNSSGFQPPVSSEKGSELKFDDDFGPFHFVPPFARETAQITPSGAAPLNEDTDTDTDVGLPTRAEIIETSRMLFPHLTASQLGNASTASSTTGGTPSSRTPVSSTSAPNTETTAPSKPTSDSTTSLDSQSHHSSALSDSDRESRSPQLPSDEDPEQDSSQEPFDLTTLLPTLQDMRDRIATLPMEERRREAARVALGLVWALDAGVDV